MDGRRHQHPHRDATFENDRKFALDDQTGKRFRIKREDLGGLIAATVAGLYLAGMLAFLLWMLFDTWAGRNTVLTYYGYREPMLASDQFRLVAYVVLGGALGGTVDGIRSIISWHSEREAYGPRFLWKDGSLPLMGAAVGLMVYAIVRGGAGVVTGDFSIDRTGGSPALAAFAIAALAGFSAQQVFRWMDAQANKIFRVTKGTQTVSPDLTGKTAEEAGELLKSRNLVLGDTHQRQDDANIGKVVEQAPGPGLILVEGEAVDITVGVKTPAP